MKIIHIATSLIGGAGVAAIRMNDALNLIGMDSILISNSVNEMSKNPNVIGIKKSKIDTVKSKTVTFSQQKVVQRGEDLVTLFSASTLNLKEILNLGPDLIHIHSFYNLLNTKDIKTLIDTKIPIIFTLHDERILTGGCHCTNGCNLFEAICESCPQTKICFRQSISNERLKWRGILDSQSITLVCPSKWMAEQVEKAGLISITHPQIIRNPTSKSYLNSTISQRNKKADSNFTVTFISQDLQNSYKGLKEILRCISLYAAEFTSNDIEFKFVGHGPKLDVSGVKHTQLPNLREMDLIEVYKSTDLLLVPSKTDNSPNVVFEAALCGTPFLGSNKAGLPELSELFGFKTFEYGNSENLFMRIIEAKHFKHDRAMIRRTALESVDPRKIAETLRVLYQAKITEEASRRSGKVL